MLPGREVPEGMRGFLAIAFFLCGHLSSMGQAEMADTLKEVVITGKVPAPGKPFKNKVLHNDSLPSLLYGNLADKLRQETGIFVRSFSSNGVASLSFRGTGAAHTQLYWNGLNLIAPTVGQADFSIVPTGVADQVQVRYGLASLTDGPGGLGGSISLHNEADWDNRLQVKLSQEAGSFDYFRSVAEVHLGGKKWQSATGLYYATAQNDFPFPDITRKGNPVSKLGHAAYWQKGAFQHIYFRPAQNHVLSLKTWYSDYFRENPAPITSSTPSEEYLRDRMLNAVAAWKRAGPDNMLAVSSGASTLSNLFDSPVDSLGEPINYVSWQNNIRYQKWLLKGNLKLEAGAKSDYNRVSSSGYPDKVNQLRNGIFLKAMKKIRDKAGLTLLIREEWVDGQWSPLIGSLGGYYETGSLGLVKLNVARNYRYPSLNDLHWHPGGNSELLPEESFGMEAGYALGIEKDKSPVSFEMELTVFHNEVSNWIIWVPEGSFWSPRNIKKVRNRGIEAWAGITWSKKGWRISGHLDYTFLESRNKAFYSQNSVGLDKELIYVPGHKFSGNLKLDYRSFSLAYLQQYTGRYFVSTDNQVYMPAYSVADLSAAYTREIGKQGHALQLSVAVRNLYDWPYQVMAYRPEPGRNYRISLTYTFNK